MWLQHLEYMYNHDIYVEALPSVFTTYMELEKAGYHSDEPWLSIESAIKGLHHIEWPRLSTVLVMNIQVMLVKAKFNIVIM